MKTKELIEMLKEADPSGECHVRIEGLSPSCCVRKPGYWDGPYQYVEDDTLVFSTKGEKVDIYLLETFDWVGRHLDDWRDKVRVEYDYSDKRYANEVIERLEAEEKEIREILEHI